MKRNIWHVLVCCSLLISMLALPVHAEEEKTQSAEFLESVALLSAFGILPAGADRWDENGKISKSDVIYSAVHMLNLPMPYFSEYGKDLQIPEDNLYGDEIRAAQGLGILKDLPSGSFAADEPVLYSEALCILMNTLGYRVYAGENGGYPLGYLAAAGAAGLNSGLKLNDSEPLSRKQAVKLLRSAIEADLMYETKDNNNASRYDVKKGYTVLTENFKAYKKRGIVTELYKQAISEDAVSKSPGKDEIVIGQVVYSLNGIKADKLLGYTVEFYYSDEDGTLTIRYIQPKNNDTLLLEKEDVVGFSDNILTYTDKKGTQCTVRLSTAADVVFNGRAYGMYLPENFLFTNSDGWLELVDNDENGQMDVAFINSYVSGTVSAYNQDDQILYLKDPDQSFAFDDADVFTVKGADQSEKDPSEITAGQIASVLRSKDGSYVTVYLSGEVVSGVVNEWNADESTVTVDQTAYKFSCDFTDNFSDSRIGMEVTYLLDFRGRVTAEDEDKIDETLIYGFLFKAQQGTGLSPAVQVEIMKLDGSFHIYDLPDKLRFNNSQLKKEDVLLQLMSNNGSSTQYVVPQVVRYKETADGKQIMRMINGLSDDLTVDSYLGASLLNNGTVVKLADKAILTNNADVIFFPNATLAELDAVGERDVSITHDIESYRNFNGQTMDAMVIDADDGGVSKLMVLYYPWKKNIAIGGNDSYLLLKETVNYMVDQVTYRLNEDGEQVPVLRVMAPNSNMRLQDYEVLDENIVKKQVFDSTGKMLENQYKFLRRGDIIRMVVDPNKRVRTVRLDYDMDRVDNGRFNNHITQSQTSQYDQGSGMQWHFDCGIALNRTGYGIRMLTTVKSGAPEFGTADVSEIFDMTDSHVLSLISSMKINTNGEANYDVWYLTNVNIIVYDTKKDALRSGTLSDVIDCRYENVKPSIVFFRCFGSYERSMFVIN